VITGKTNKSHIIKVTVGKQGIKKTHLVPPTFALLQNYPNPFNPETRKIENESKADSGQPEGPVTSQPKAPETDQPKRHEIDQTEAEFYRNYYEGELNEYKVSMVLSLEDSNLKGYYLYRCVGERIDLSGSIEKGFQFTIKESVNNEITGEFRGKFISAFDGIEGEWSNPDGKKRMPFKLTKVAEFKTIKSDKFDVEIEYPQFVLDNSKAQIQLNSTIDARVQGIYQEFINAIDEEDDYEITKNWNFIFRTTDIAYFSDDLLSFILEVEEYTGGNRPNFFYIFYNLRLNNDSVSEIG